MPLQDRSASTAAGNKLLTAVPEVVITKERLPDAAEIPREWNPADLSSTVSYTHLTLPTNREV